MEDPKERLTSRISTEELERRWTAVREMMQNEKLDYLIVRNDEGFMGGNVKWFTDLSARTNQHLTVIFPVDEEMTLISHGPASPSEPPPPAWAVRGVKTRLAAPYFASAHYTNSMDGELAVDVLKEKPGATIGLVGKSYIPVSFFEYLKRNLSGVTFVDVTEQVDRIKVVKSPEEIELIKAFTFDVNVAIGRSGVPK